MVHILSVGHPFEVIKSVVTAVLILMVDVFFLLGVRVEGSGYKPVDFEFLMDARLAQPDYLIPMPDFESHDLLRD